MESCDNNIDQRRKSMALVVQADTLPNNKQRLTYFFKKFTSLKLLVKPDFLLLGISRCLLEICLDLMIIYFPFFSTRLLDVEKEAALWLRTCFPVSNTIGGFLTGFMIDKNIMEVNTLTIVTNCSAGVLVFLFQYMPGFISQAFLMCALGVLLGSQSLTNALILMKFYERSVLASALAMTENFRTIGSSIAPLIFTYLMDSSLNGIVVWGVGGITCLTSGLLIMLASYFNKKNTKIWNADYILLEKECVHKYAFTVKHLKMNKNKWVVNVYFSLNLFGYLLYIWIRGEFANTQLNTTYLISTDSLCYGDFENVDAAGLANLD